MIRNDATKPDVALNAVAADLENMVITIPKSINSKVNAGVQVAIISLSIICVSFGTMAYTDLLPSVLNLSLNLTSATRVASATARSVFANLVCYTLESIKFEISYDAG